MFYQDAPVPFTLGPDTILCAGQSLSLFAPTIAYTITWQNGSQEPVLIVTSPGLYSLQVSNECRTVTDTIEVADDNNIPQVDFDTTIPWCEGDILTLNAEQSFVATYSWNTGETSSTIDILTPGVYSVEVSTTCHTSNASVEVLEDIYCEKAKNEIAIYIPNVFSPNGDGINDVFSVSWNTGFEVISTHGSIYDRWGGLVFSSAQNPFVWNGLFDGEEVMPGVFVYTITITYIDDGEERSEVLTGDVTVLR